MTKLATKRATHFTDMLADEGRTLDIEPALPRAEQLSYHTDYPVHVYTERGGYFRIYEETDYISLPRWVVNRIVYPADPKMADID